MLRLRPYKPMDAKAVTGWFSDEETFVKWSAGQFSYPLTEGQLADYYKKWEKDGAGWPMAALDETGRVAGHLLMRMADYRENSLFFGFIAVDPALRGRGYGREMVSLALRYAFEILKVDTVRLRVFASNPGARRCYEAAGFRVERRMDQGFSYRGEVWENDQMIARRQDWQREEGR